MKRGVSTDILPLLLAAAFAMRRLMGCETGGRAWGAAASRGRHGGQGIAAQRGRLLRYMMGRLRRHRARVVAPRRRLIAVHSGQPVIIAVYSGQPVIIAVYSGNYRPRRNHPCGQMMRVVIAVLSGQPVAAQRSSGGNTPVAIYGGPCCCTVVDLV